MAAMEEQYTLHRHVVDNDMAALKAALQTSSYDVDGVDHHGNTPLLLAIGLGRAAMVELLLENGADASKKNEERWPPVAEAISYGHRPTVKCVTQAYIKQTRDMVRQKTAALLRAIDQLPDFYMEIDWEFHSWVPLVSRVLPNDTLCIWKKGTKVRMDTTLLDVSEKTLHRGNLSFLLNADPQKGTIELVSLRREDKVYGVKPLLMSEDDLELEASRAEALEEHIDMMMTSGIVDVDCMTRNMEFTRALAGWYGFREERSETIGAYECRVFHINNIDFVSRSRKEHVTPEDEARNKEINRLLRSDKEDIDDELEQLKPPSRSLPPPPCDIRSWDQYAASDTVSLGRTPVIAHKTKRFSATAWMTDDFPLPLENVVQLLSILAPTTKHVARLRDFIDAKLPAGFPVKLDIPVFPTVSARVQFRQYEEREVEDEVFEIPDDFEEVVFVSKSKRPQSLRRNRTARSVRPRQDGESEDEAEATEASTTA